MRIFTTTTSLHVLRSTQKARLHFLFSQINYVEKFQLARLKVRVLCICTQIEYIDVGCNGKVLASYCA